ncbi:alkaline phosphatase D family protein [Sulfurimonas sp. HSL1-2]|uniref:alkaline phosphatase D family protein n=1 Tax=Thiomicrolovo zhangzhouensis TaxID=3131933 RepID=UPI0031F95473
MDRRGFLKHFSALAAAGAAATTMAGCGSSVTEGNATETDSALLDFDPDNASAAVFPQSIASGDPASNGVILWTRVSPDAITDSTLPVGYEIASDEAFENVLLQGSAVVNPAELNHTVKLKVTSDLLLPATTYYYRFVYAQTASRTGCFKTLPETGMASVRFAFLSCQDYTNGYYTAYDHLVQEEIDCVLWLGDYIYEAVGDPSYQNNLVRTITLPSGALYAQDLADYYHLYNTYRSDEKLQRVHERFTFITIWDDHEFANDCYDGDHAPDHNYTADGNAEGLFNLRLAANLAWFANQPVDVWYDAQSPTPFNIRIYRTFRFGELMELVLTDQRLYRSAHPCGEGEYGERYVTPGCDGITDPGRTMLGSEQKRWFLDTVRRSGRRWVFWGNEVTLMQMKLTGIAGLLESYFNLDQWDGFQAERQEIIDAVATYKAEGTLQNFVALTGDIHSYITGHLTKDFNNPLAEIVAPEFVGTSVTSSNLYELGLGLASSVSGDSTLSALLQPLVEQMEPEGVEEAMRIPNPHIGYFNSHQHGYAVAEVSTERVTVSFRAVATIRETSASVTTIKRFEVGDGTPVMKDVTAP